jgi:hypothetical protein
MTKPEDNSFGIYERGHGNYRETMKYWAKQREGIAKRLMKFARGVHSLDEAVKFIEEAKKKNKDNLPF